ncbi:unnamed protein product [Prunus armeniaca]|uniref:Transmembrane protein n=1 Tax=Prunus armeniaca TaxID=36596 RepID=A0A6J5UN02_PRUAR|nr:unnamed protein product [Prunus armeniaca]
MASSSKSFLLLDFIFALVILISSEVSARELAEITKPAIPIRGNTYPFEGTTTKSEKDDQKKTTVEEKIVVVFKKTTVTTPKCDRYIRPCHMTPPPPKPQPGPGVVEIEIGN